MADDYQTSGGNQWPDYCIDWDGDHISMLLPGDVARIYDALISGDGCGMRNALPWTATSDRFKQMLLDDLKTCLPPDITHLVQAVIEEHLE